VKKHAITTRCAPFIQIGANILATSYQNTGHAKTKRAAYLKLPFIVLTIYLFSMR
tara:strand:+ start:283439 stop:283603 length:165 start_codon:yes stop_codon:yes gene_type:complete